MCRGSGSAGAKCCVCPYRVGSYCVGSYCVGPYRVGSYCVCPYRVGSYRVQSYRVGSYHVRSYCVRPYWVGSLACQVLLCRVSTCSAGLFSVGPWCGNFFEGLRAASLYLG